jgi:hypothetical protein
MIECELYEPKGFKNNCYAPEKLLKVRRREFAIPDI